MVERVETVNVNGREIELSNDFIEIKTRDGKVRITEHDAEKLWEQLFEVLYDEPSYDELTEKNSDLEYQVEDLKGEVEYLREQLEDIRYRRFG